MRGGHGGCERRIEVFVKIQKKFKNLGGGGGGRGGGGRVGEVRVDVNEELKFLRKFTKKDFRGCVWGGGGGVGWGGQGGCERRIEVFEKIHKKWFWGAGGGGGGGGQGSGWVEGQGGCERRIEVFVKIQKKIWGSGWM